MTTRLWLDVDLIRRGPLIQSLILASGVGLAKGQGHSKSGKLLALRQLTESLFQLERMCHFVRYDPVDGWARLGGMPPDPQWRNK